MYALIRNTRASAGFVRCKGFLGEARGINITVSLLKPRPRHPRMNSGASLLFHLLLLKRYATANDPAIEKMASKHGVSGSDCVDFGNAGSSRDGMFDQFV